MQVQLAWDSGLSRATMLGGIYEQIAMPVAQNGKHWYKQIAQLYCTEGTSATARSFVAEFPVNW